MARRRRAVERASQRRTIADRILVGVLVVVAASGLMSVLPAQSQVAVSRFACRVGSLGLGSCGSAELALGVPELNPPRCAVLAALDTAIPEVRVTDRATAEGLAVQTRSTRSGDTVLRLGPADDVAPPFPLEAEPRADREVLPGVSVPVRAEWYLPGGQGADIVVQAARERHHQWVQRRSSLAVLAVALGDRGRDVPAPTLLTSQVRLDTPALPRAAGRAGNPPIGRRPPSFVAVDPARPALLQFNRVTRDTSLVVGLQGVVSRTPVVGTARWTRDPTGAVRTVVVGIVSAGRLAPGEPGLPAAAGRGPRATDASTGVVYLTVPVTSEAERALVQAWLSDARGFRLGLEELLGLKAANPRDQLASFLTRAATVTILRYAGTDRDQAARQVRAELATLQRVEWPDAKLLAASAIAPQPNRSPRTVRPDPSCPAA